MTVEGERGARLREQHALRMAYMPWLYHRAKPEIRAWAVPWQRELHAALAALEALEIHEDAFVAPTARLFAEPHRAIRLAARSSVAADCFLHGPITLGQDSSLNVRVTLDGGRAGITIGPRCRIATGVTMFAFDHGIAADAPVLEQPVRSKGITLGEDVWVCANAGITDGVSVGDHAVVAMGAVVTRDVPAWAIVGGVPARVIGSRQDGFDPSR